MGQEGCLLAKENPEGTQGGILEVMLGVFASSIIGQCSKGGMQMVQQFIECLGGVLTPSMSHHFSHI